ncbi:MAG: UDP-N-acetylglucosamine 2-epimerase, partial [Oscillospiraceae bacterium]
AVKKIVNDLTDVDFTKSIMVVHGDTVSTFMGALIGKRLKMKIAHVEAGLRSHDIFNPFPEEIDRILTSRRTDIHFAPGDVPCENLKGKHNVVNTRLNTIYDSLQYSYKIPCKNDLVKQLNGQEYFVFVLHRQENLMQKELVESIVNSVINISKQIKCVIILHKPTEITLAELGILQGIENNEQFYTTPRMEYFDFMKLLANSQFVITDGGSNQEELYYMGKPCLILRKSTERNEGIGINAVMYGGNIDWIRRFSEDYPNYIKNPIIAKTPPSDIIYEKLVEVLQGDI